MKSLSNVYLMVSKWERVKLETNIIWILKIQSWEMSQIGELYHIIPNLISPTKSLIFLPILGGKKIIKNIVKNIWFNSFFYDERNGIKIIFLRRSIRNIKNLYFYLLLFYCFCVGKPSFEAAQARCVCAKKRKQIKKVFARSKCSTGLYVSDQN